MAESTGEQPDPPLDDGRRDRDAAVDPDLAALGLDADLDIDVARIEAEERIAARRLSAIEAGRRKAGILGAATAGAMLGLRDIYEGPPKEDDIVVVAESPGDPGDIDLDGIRGTIDEVDYWAPPPFDPRREA